MAGGTRGPVPVPLESQDRNLTQEILDLLDTKPTLQSSDDFPAISQAEIKAALDRLASRSMVEYQSHDSEQAILTPEAESIVAEGSHEYKVWDAVRQAGKIPIKELPKIVGTDTAKVGQGNAFKNKWVKKDGDSLVLVADEVKDSTRELLRGIQETKTLSDAKVLNDLKKRKLVTVGKVITYTVSKGPKYAKEIPVEVTDLTAEMIASGAWESANFKPYNFNALGASQDAGALHPLMKVRQEFRNIFFSQGFVEMPTSHFVDSGFWNFDALFVPQQHPARDMQDTFFISDPPKADKPRADPDTEATLSAMEAGSRRLFASPDKQSEQTKPRDYEQYWKNIKEVHQEGGFGSRGYRYPWSEDESLRLVLRTHTTAVSTWVLHRLSEDPRPARYFSIDRVFRNETVDATHLAEFHQIEGVIADFGLTLGGLMRFLEDFFAKMGLENLRFKPAYNPYTEPSMEIFGFHKGLNRWLEIGNSGMFRPEMLEPMGLPKDMRVYGFGLSLERPTMMKYGVSNIRELLGHKCDLNWIKAQPAVRLDKD
ncbi:tRNA synthetases class II core domain (F)-domain-containing protein [Massariosphaeria phaeospora]|uniref:phenylalanine--tRNA ligase n=1 Tax=Massariosphaeria phaeospora TaxID=100035 RepID=A0A7C8MFR5_9PLEO|nr:tRNA synthetases class II core domain (F)-domain-containing protein [Massariosphaeria phaeospora]